MPPPADDSGDERLLHCSLDRTLLLHRDAATGAREVHKLLLRGSPLDADREHAVARLLDGLGVVEPLGAGTHPATGRPVVRTRFYDGTSLDRLVAERGALSAREACAVLHPVAVTLAAMHARRTPDARNGLCHGDVKPANLLRTESTTLLLDFEHAGPAGSGTCAGTPGFAGPEALVGAPLTPAFDVFGLGATLHWLLTGGDPRALALAAHDEEVQLLVSACTSPSPTARPSAATVAEALHELAARLSRDPLESARAALFEGDLARCEALLLGLDPAARAAVERQLARRRRLIARRPQLEHGAAALDAAARADDAPEALAAFLRGAAAALRRFPRRPDLVAAIHRSRAAAVARIAELLPTISELAKKEQFARAHERLRALDDLLLAASRLPGSLPLHDTAPTAMPSLLQRSPRTCLQQEAQRLREIEHEHQNLLATLHAAEQELALDDAAAVVDRIGAAFGGASEAVARHRDRLHRLAFYAERAAQARSNLERLRELVPDHDPAALLAFVDACRDALAHTANADGADARSVGLRSLHLALRNLAEEFPSLRERVAPGLDALDRMLAKVTDEAWELVAQAGEKLVQEPVPVRPLQLLLARLDTLRALEALVDQPQRTRSALLDRIEALRLRIEQAQATRDRLARGAEQALAKGHWTTGLFDMERAAQHLDGGDDLQDRQAAHLKKRLAEAKRRKQELEDAQKRNHELQSRYAAMLDDPASTAPARQQVLREQRDCLQFLVVHSQRERSALYARDARDVELRLAQEAAQQAELELDQCTDPALAVRVAERAVRELEDAGKAFSTEPELPGRLSRLLEHWRRRHKALQRDLEERLRTESRRRFRYRAATAIAAGLLIALFAWLQSDPPAALAASHPLAPAVESLPRAARAPAVELSRELARLGETPTVPPDEVLSAAETAITRTLARGTEYADFARTAFDLVVRTERARCSADELAEFDASADAARTRLSALGMAK